MLRPVALVTLAALLLPVGAATADGPNVAPNAGFDLTIVDWTVGLGSAATIGWAPTDAGGKPGSGSAKLVSQTLTSDAGAAAESTCIPVSPGASYLVGGSLWVQPQTANDRSTIGYRFHPEATCSSSAAASVLPFVATPGWTPLAKLITAPAGKHGLRLVLLSGRGTSPSGPFTTYFDDVFLRTATCAPSPTQLCLAGGRFAVTATWSAAGNQGAGGAVPFSADSGSFWFFAPSNLELDVKLLDACGLNQRFWVFAAGLTDVAVTLTVTDTQTNATKTYTNPAGRTFVTITDTSAFATCS